MIQTSCEHRTGTFVTVVHCFLQVNVEMLRLLAGLFHMSKQFKKLSTRQI